MKKIIFIAGLPGVGKSTISRIIAGNNGRIVDIDDFKKVVYKNSPELDPTQLDPPEIRWAYYQLAVKHAMSMTADKVVIDETFHLQVLRGRLEDFCVKLGAEVEWVHVLCTSETVEKRLRAKARVGHILSTDDAIRMHHLFHGIFQRFPKGKKNLIVVDNNNDD
ncbi:MAG: AAA family ATPase [Patescibacteria group bacterium]